MSQRVSERAEFALERARATIEEALAAAGFDVVADPAELHLIQARRDQGRDSTTVVIDAGGTLRYTRTRQAAPDVAQTRRAAGRTFKVVREATETATVCCRLATADEAGFAALLATLDRIV